MKKQAVFIVLLIIASTVLHAQSPQLATGVAFAAASVKENKSPDFRNGALQLLPGGRFVARNIPLIFVIDTAYDLPVLSNRITGIPDWARKQIYDIEATAEPSAIPANALAKERDTQIRLMLQTLLAERFKMTVHRESKQLPMYAILIDKNGPKLEQATVSEQDCASQPTTFSDSNSCHSIAGGQGQGLHGKAVTISDVVKYVEGFSDRPVVDKTNLDGLYNIQTDGWVPMRPRPPVPSGQEPSAEDLAFADPARPTLFQIFGRLGLKLDPETGPVETFVIDHIEEPSPN